MLVNTEASSLYIAVNSEDYAYMKRAHLLSIISRSSHDLWMLALSMTMTEFGLGNGFMTSRSPSIKLLNSRAVYGWSSTARCRIPSRERAGRIEYLGGCWYEEGETMETDAPCSTDEKVSSARPTPNWGPPSIPPHRQPIHCGLINEDELVRVIVL
jgi:hypothetical protein